jgi:Replication-relaxation
MFQPQALFERPENLGPLELLPLDVQIIRHVKRHRFLSAAQLIRATDEKKFPVLGRLEKLFDHGYLNRPKSQWKWGNPLKRIDLVYGLAKRGTRYLKELGELESIRIHEKKVGDYYLEHTLEVAEFMTRLERDLPINVTLEYLDDGVAPQRAVAQCSWTVPIFFRGDLIEVGVVPDRVFSLKAGGEILYFCLELDRGTMPVIRTNPAQSSFYRKLLAYHETWRSGLHTEQMGWRRFRVITLTSSAMRKDHLLEVCKEIVINGGSGLFMFADKETFENEASVAMMPWLTGDGQNIAKLISETRS